MTQLKPYPLPTVGGLIIASDGEVLLVRSKKWNDLYTLPGGKIEIGETREQAFIREVYEETQLKITNIRRANVQDCISPPDFYKPDQHFVMNDFVADLAPHCRKQDIVLNDEGYEYLWTSPENARKLPSHKEVYVLLDWYMARRDILGSIGFDDHKIRCIIGELPDERILEQDIFIDLKAEADFSKCVKTDSVYDTVDYVAMAELCTTLAQQGQYRMLEMLAFQITERMLHDYPVRSIWIRIKKPGAIATTKYSFVELKRSRSMS